MVTVQDEYAKFELNDVGLLFQSVVTKDVTSGKVTKAAEKAQKKK